MLLQLSNLETENLLTVNEQLLKLSRGQKILRKQVAYVGSFVDPKTDTKFRIDDSWLSHWLSSINFQIEKGIEIPMPIEHKLTPDSNRGFVIGAEIAFDKQNRNSLYCFCIPSVESHLELLLSSNVSLWSPNQWKTGSTEMKNPLKHVALTSYPVLDGLEPFEFVLSAIEPTKQKALKMTLQELATKLGITETEDAKIMDAVLSLFETLTGQKEVVASLTQQKTELEKQLNAAKRKEREFVLSGLAGEGYLTAAGLQTAKEQYCGETLDAGFDAFLSITKKNGKVLKLSATSGGTLENPKTKETETALTMAERIAKKHAKK